MLPNGKREHPVSRILIMPYGFAALALAGMLFRIMESVMAAPVTFLHP